MRRSLLQNAGLSENEAQIYRMMLERGELSPPEVAETLGMTRQNAYLVLAELAHKGLCRKDDRHNKIRYNPADPERLTQLCSENIRKVKNYREDLNIAMPELKGMYNLAKNRPGINVFKGVEGIQRLYKDTLKKSPGEILLILSEKGKSKYMMTWIERHFRPERIKKGISLREITNTPAEHNEEELKALLWEKKYVDMPEMPRDLDILIYDDNVTFIRYNRKEPFGFTIDDPLIYFALKAMFETCWKI